MSGHVTIRQGWLAQFIDPNATPLSAAGGEPVLASGLINGEPLEADGVTLVPVFTTRSGREPTTVWVPQANIVSTTPPS